MARSRPQPPRPVATLRPPERDVILLLFHTIAQRHRFAGNTQLAVVAGELKRLGIDSQSWVVGIRPGEDARNAAALDELIDGLRRRRPSFVATWAHWLPWLPERLRAESGARVISLDPAQPGDIPAALRELDPVDAVVATIAGAADAAEARDALDVGTGAPRFEPRFEYHFVGTPPVPHEMAHVTISACPYGAPVADNPHYRDLALGPEVADRGCAYCNAAWGHEALPEDEKRRRLAQQVVALQRALPELREIALPFPEDHVAGLTALLRDAGRHGLRPVIFSGQFNAASVARDEAALDRLLTAAAAAGCTFRIGVVGLESFRDDDLRRFNRGSEADVRGALAVLRRLRARHDPDAFMPDTVGSFVLFHPWQTLDGLRHNAAAMRQERVEALFAAINVNDVRFHPGVAMYHRAARDGLLAEERGDPVHGAPLGGYFAERPWRFADPQVAAVHRLFAALAEHTPHRVGLLDACLRAVQRAPDDPPDPGSVIAALGALSRLGQDRGAPGGERRVLALAGDSNVGTPLTLDAGLRRHEDPAEGLAELRRQGPLGGAWVTLCGPEPTLRKDLPQWIAALRGAGAGTVEVLTHGRMLAYERYAAGLVAAGVGGVAVLLHRATPADHDRVVRVPGAFEQATAGLRRLAALAPPRTRTTVAVPVGSANVGELAALVDLAATLGARELRLLTPWETLELADLDRWREALAAAMDRAAARGLLTGVDRHFRAEIARPRPEDEG